VTAALDGLSRSWAIELAPRQITGNVVAPGPTETAMLADPARRASPPQLPRLGRLIQPSEIANLVGFLLGPTGRSITEQRLVVCAGALL
jgi:NAD(P)-dependent dehydrogenase (short-subunit alcohol dehydrogenase family)